MSRKLRLPETLALVILAGACVGDPVSSPDAREASDAAVTDAASDAHAASDAALADADNCVLFCIPDQAFDDGGVIADGGPPVQCPNCADPHTGQCPSGCRPVG